MSSSSATTDEARAEQPAGQIDTDGTLPGADVARAGAEVAIRHCDAPSALPEMMRLAAELAEADILPGHLRRRPANVLALMFAARALDIPIWVAFQSLYLIDGKVGMDATFQRSLIIRAGHRFRVLERTEHRAAVEITRHDDPEPRVSEFTWADAVEAGLTEKKIWHRYPKAMLMARVTTLAIRDHCPEVLFSSAYTPEELDVVIDDTGTPVTVIPSERVHDGAVSTETSPAAGPSADAVRARAAALRAEYERRINLAESADDLNGIWRDAKAGGVLGAPLGEETVEQALWARADELRAVAQAREALAAQGVDVIDVEPEPEQ